MTVDPKFTAYAQEMISSGRWPAGELEDTESEDGMNELGDNPLSEENQIEVLRREITRLRELEAREAMVVNLMAAWVDVIDNKMTRDRFEELLKRSEAEMCRAIECLGRRDKIRKLEGAEEALLDVLHRGHIRRAIKEAQVQLADARAGK